MTAPVVERVADILIGLGFYFLVNHSMHHIDGWSLHRKSIRHSYFDKQRSSRVGKLERYPELFLVLSALDNSGALVESTNLLDL